MIIINRNSTRVTPLPYLISRRCRGKKSLREGTFFADFLRIPLKKLLIVIYLWGQRELRSKVSSMVGLTKNSVGRVFATFCFICKRDLVDRPVIPFGGRVFVVKCDESQFKPKSKVSQYTVIYISNYRTEASVRNLVTSGQL